MPRAHLMSWEGHPHYRWVKMYKGVRYRVTCQELKSRVTTKEGSVNLANEWWRRKLAELTGGDAAVEAIRQILKGKDPLSRLAADVRETERYRNEVIKDILAAASTISDETGGTVEGQINPEWADVHEAIGVSSLGAPQATDRTFKHHAERFLQTIQGEMKPLSYREIRDFIRSLYALPIVGAGRDVGEVNEALVESVFLWFKAGDVQPGTRQKRWGFFRRLVRYLWSNRLIDLPRNLDALNFKVSPTAVKTYPLGEVRACLRALKPRLRLYALLGLNCGMTAADIGQLRKDQVNLTAGRLIRKRVKTEGHANVPTVDYKLWPETLKLLSEHWSAHPELALTSADNTPLWSSRQEGDRTPTTNLIYHQYRLARAKITLKAFRSISATLIESHETYGRYVGHFLGHSPKSIKEKHYAAPSKELFDAAMAWLRKEIYPKSKGRG